MDIYTYWLDRVENITKKEKFMLLKELGSGEEIYRASMLDLIGVLGNIEKAQTLINQRKIDKIKWNYDKLLKENIRFCGFMEDAYPQRLRMIPDPPLTLYYLGNLPKEEQLSVAIIGARECSEYGKYVARELGKYLGEKGVQVISGMAKGIDGISQQAALEVGGMSYGVLGCGVDVCYPKENIGLYEQLKKQGGLLSIYHPMTQPKPQLFPPRNRIVSGLADALVVVEARQKSGTLITVDMALEQARDVYIVPGRVTDRLSDGCNQLLKDGAHVFLNPSDFFRTLSEQYPDKVFQDNKCKENLKKKTEQENLSEEELLVYQLLDYYPQNYDQMSARLREMERQDVLANLSGVLMKLCMIGKCKQISTGWFQKCEKE